MNRLLFVMLAAAVSVAAQDQPIVIAAGTTLDGTGKILRNTRIVVEHGKIARIDPKASPVTYDLRGMTVLPGLIDVHVHITYHFGPRGNMATARSLRSTPNSRSPATPGRR